MARRRRSGVPPVVERWPHRYEHVLTLGQDERPVQSFGALPSPAPAWVSGHWKPLKPGNFGWLVRSATCSSGGKISSRSPLPYFGTGKTLLIASDAAGDHATPYKVYAFLATAEASLWPWAEAVAEMRSTWLSQRGPMSFKDLNDGCRARALVPFFKTANEIPGLLLVVAMNKTVGELLDERLDRWLFSELAHWKPAVREELFRSICLVSLLSSGFARPGQDLLWVSDNDDILANADRMREVVPAMSRMVSGLASHPTGRIYLTTPAHDDSNQKLEDLLAIPIPSRAPCSTRCAGQERATLPNSLSTNEPARSSGGSSTGHV